MSGSMKLQRSDGQPVNGRFGPSYSSDPTGGNQTFAAEAKRRLEIG
ncbi:MAG: hypothetical protein ACJASS_001720 [Sulfitobacter sp.]|jgi:hypothetical protein